MRIVRYTAAAAMGLALFAAPLFQTGANAEPRYKRYRHSRPVYPQGCPTHRAVDGVLVDCHGYRNVSGTWDTSCFNLDYMPSMFACGASGRR